VFSKKRLISDLKGLGNQLNVVLVGILDCNFSHEPALKNTKRKVHDVQIILTMFSKIKQIQKITQIHKQLVYFQEDE
jgi:hypothetical protein